MFGRAKLALVAAEFFGTAALTAVVLSVGKSGVGLPYFIALAAALTVGLMLLVLGNARNITFNPAITIGLWTTRQVDTLSAVVSIAAQALGAVAAWQVFEYLTEAPLRSLAAGEFDWRLFTAETIGAFVLGLAYAAAAYYNHTETRLASTVGAGVFLGIVLASVASNGLINPALALGVQSWSLAYVLGPIAGAVLAVNLYGLVFAPAGSFKLAGLASSSKTVSARPKKTAAKKPAARKKTARKTTRKR